MGGAQMDEFETDELETDELETDELEVRILGSGASESRISELGTSKEKSVR